MANVKQVIIIGKTPFNLAEHPDLCRKLGQMNTPTFGLRIQYGPFPIEHRPNEHGGQTAYYHFEIKGTEAVSTSWLKALCNDLKEVGADIQTDIHDMEANEKITLE